MGVMEYQIQRLKEIGVDGPVRGSEASIIRRSEIYKQKLEQGSMKDKRLEIFKELESQSDKEISEVMQYIAKYRQILDEPFPITFCGSDEDIISTIKECISKNKPIEMEDGVDY